MPRLARFLHSLIKNRSRARVKYSSAFRMSPPYSSASAKRKQTISEKKASPPPRVDTDHTWFWEGSIQDRIVEYLRAQRIQITSTANTHTRESGKDIQGKSPDGTVLWISVKGYPIKSSHTQARHWFAELLFDLILYRSENANAQLGIGLPYGFATYRNLARRIDWFKQSLPFQFYWVHEDGTVTTE